MRFLILAFCLTFFPLSASASVIITEIYADATGSDEGKEWVEVKNTGTSAIDIATIVFVEGGQQHTLESVQGSASLAPGGVLIIVDDLSGFLSVVSGYVGQVADSSWGSLTNTGEVLAIQIDGVVVDTSTYSAVSGEGMSVHRSGSAWVSGNPTPGVYDGAGGSTQTTTQVTETVVATSTPTSFSVVEKPRSVIIHIPQQIIAGLAANLSADVANAPSVSSPFTTYQWSLGNGAVRSGKQITYRFPYAGTFTIAVVAKVGSQTYREMRTVSVVEPAVALLRSGPEVIVITNTSEELFDMSGWHIVVSGVKKTFDEGMMLPPATSVSLDRNEMGMPYAEGEVVELHLPLGGVVSRLAPAALEESPSQFLASNWAQPVIAARSVAATEEKVLPEQMKFESSIQASAGEAPEIPPIIWLAGLLLASGGIVVLSGRYL